MLLSSGKIQRINAPYLSPCFQHAHFHLQLGKSKERFAGACFHGRASVAKGFRRRSPGFQVLAGCPHCVENDNVTITSLQQKVGLAVHCPKCLEIPGLEAFFAEKLCWKVAYSVRLQNGPTYKILSPPKCGPNLQLMVCSRLPREASAPVPDR